jgi:hypothetical protein
VNAVTYTCFGCFAETASYPPATGQVLYCAGCHMVLETGTIPAPTPGPVCTFGVSDADRQAMVEKRVVEAYIAEAESDAILAVALRIIAN